MLVIHCGWLKLRREEGFAFLLVKNNQKELVEYLRSIQIQIV